MAKGKEEGKEKEKVNTKFKLTIQGEDYYADTDYTKTQPWGSPVTTPNGTNTKGIFWDKDKKLTFDEPSGWGSITDESATPLTGESATDSTS
jgi:hypothetical protein